MRGLLTAAHRGEASAVMVHAGEDNLGIQMVFREACDPLRRHAWLQIFEIFKMKVQNTRKIPKFQNTPTILKFIKILRIMIFKIFQILVRRFRAISGVLRRFLRIFPRELEKC